MPLYHISFFFDSYLLLYFSKSVSSLQFIEWIIQVITCRNDLLLILLDIRFQKCVRKSYCALALLNENIFLLYSCRLHMSILYSLFIFNNATFCFFINKTRRPDLSGRPAVTLAYLFFLLRRNTISAISTAAAASSPTYSAIGVVSPVFTVVVFLVFVSVSTSDSFSVSSSDSTVSFSLFTSLTSVFSSDLIWNS